MHPNFERPSFSGQSEQEPEREEERKTPESESEISQKEGPAALERAALASVYQQEILRFRAEQTTPGKRTWRILEALAEKRPARTPEEKAPSPKPLSFIDRVRRQGLALQARLEGVKDINRFQGLVDYFESTISEQDTKYIELPKNLNDEQKKAVLEKWKTKGWQGSEYSFYKRGETTELRLERDVPLRLSREHVHFIKNLISEKNDPVQLAADLCRLGFRFSEWQLGNKEIMEELSRFFTSPNAERTLALAAGLSWWGSDWFKGQSFASGRFVERGQIDFLIELAQSPDPESVLPPDLVKKIDIVARTLEVDVNAEDITRLKTIVEDPEKFDAVALIAELKGSSYWRINPTGIFEQLEILESEGLLRPLVELYRTGVAFPKEIRGLFDPSAPESKHENKQQVRDLLSRAEVREFLSSQEKREFAGILAGLMGPLALGEVLQLERLFGENLKRKEEAVYILELARTIGVEMSSYFGLNELSRVVADQALMSKFTDREFREFVLALKEKTGYKPNYFDFYSSKGESQLADVFANPELRRGLLQDSTAAIIKALHPDGELRLNPYQVEDYIRLGQHPRILEAIYALRDIGSDFKSSLPSVQMLEKLADSPEALAKLASPELRSLIERLNAEFKWQPKAFEIEDLLKLFDNHEIKEQLFQPENIEFIKKMRSGGIILSELEPMLYTNDAHRNLLAELVEYFGYRPVFGGSWSGSTQEQEKALNELLHNEELRTRLFSNQTQNTFQRLKEFGYWSFKLEDIETVINAPPDLPDFIGELKEKYGYKFKSENLAALVQLQTRREEFFPLLDVLVGHGYEFKTSDITYLEILAPFSSGLDVALTNLSEVMDYHFEIKDSRILAFVSENNLSPERLASLKETYNSYKREYDRDFSIGSIETVLLVENNEDTIRRFELHDYEFQLYDAERLRPLLESPNKDTLFRLLDGLHTAFQLPFNPHLSAWYLKLAQIPGATQKLERAAQSVTPEDLLKGENFQLFVVLEAEAELYGHARRLLSDDYFEKIRDAQNRIKNFMDSVYRDRFPASVSAKVFELSQKATELDQLALKLSINKEIAKAVNRDNWYEPVLKALNFQEVNEVLIKLMAEMALPAIYPDLVGDELTRKQNELSERAREDKTFDDVLKICCRSVGIYKEKYPGQETEFITLLGAIRQSLELNLAASPQKYLEKRAELSTQQFDRIFEPFSEEVRARVMKIWLDLSPRRQLRVVGSEVVTEEATLDRLYRTRDTVETDLALHLRELFGAKIKSAESGPEGDPTLPTLDQLAVYKEHLFTPEGILRQDIPRMYRNIETFIHSTQETLRNPETPKEEKARLGKGLATYQALSAGLKALYRLGTISEERLKSRKDYVRKIDKHIEDLSVSLKRLRLLDPEKRSVKVDIEALEEEVLIDLEKIKATLKEENVSGQVIFETESTVSFDDLARAPEMTTSCQRLTEVTGYNQAAYSRLLDGNNEMVNIFTGREGEEVRLARSFIELSRLTLVGEDEPRLAILIDREYINPQYQNFGRYFETEMVTHLLDRISETPEVSLLFYSERMFLTQKAEEILNLKGYRVRRVSGEYFINESNVRLLKYYDSLGGLTDVSQLSSWKFSDFYLVEKV